MLLRNHSSRNLAIISKIEQLKESINLLNVESIHEGKVDAALINKISRYGNLKRITEQLNKNLVTENVVNVLADTAFNLISGSKGTCMVFLVDNQTQSLSLFKTRKDDPRMVVKAKTGDIFDYWVVRHSIPLIIEDIKNDFRFDSDKIRLKDARPIQSLISSPLSSSNSVIGVLRLDSQKPVFFSQDDLRFLSLLSDLGAVALENSLLFQKTQDLAIHDDLTGLYTKGYFLDRLSEEYKRCLRLEKQFSVLMIDIDFFKQYNDKFGHTAGDIVLKKLGGLLREFLKNNNPLISRFGGEEFIVLLPGMNKDSAFELAGLLREKVAQDKVTLRRQDTSITVSIGVSSLPLDTRNEDELIRIADKTMYEAKQKGRNRVCCI